ncbi:MAG: chromate efflux transporter [Actinomycetota bacterium]|nr:chromate efflux transporter [Actinomycetota bacterium]
MPPERRPRLFELARFFGRLSLTAFGGPAAHIALMHRELVDGRRWVTDSEFLDVVGASNAIPGPTSSEVAMYVGRRRAGLPGLVVAGVAFVAPAAAVVGVAAWAYVRYGTTPALDDAFEGIKPVVLAVVALAVLQLGRTAMKSLTLGLIGGVVLALYAAGINEPVLLLAAAAVAAVVAVRRPRLLSAPLLLPALLAGGAGTADADLARIAAVFLKVGALLFGSGYVLLAFLHRDLVQSGGFVTEDQLLDAIAVGQFTPGPLFTTATFVGYLLAGVSGALVATVAIFLPSFLMVAALEPVVTRMRRSPTTAAALDGLNVAAVALMAGVTGVLARDAVVDIPTAVVAGVAAVVLLRWRINAAWLIFTGAVWGVLFR